MKKIDWMFDGLERRARIPGNCLVTEYNGLRIAIMLVLMTIIMMVTRTRKMWPSIFC